MNRQEYNGWTNYETWAVKLWMDNDQGSCSYWREQAEQCAVEAQEGVSAYARMTGKEIFTPLERATMALAKVIRAEYEDQNPVTDASVWVDLMSAALSKVNWDEIAKSLIEALNEAEDKLC